MKRLIVLLLALLVMAGCAVQNPQPTTVPTTEATEPTAESTQPPGAGLYIPNSPLEQQTGGAVKAYSGHKACDAVYPVGENLLMFFAGSTTSIHRYGGDTLALIGEATVHASVTPGNRGFQISDEGLSYYDADARQVVLLDAFLTEKDRVTLPENAQGIPLVDPAQTKVYFCTDDEIRVLDLETGIAGLLRQEPVAWQSIYDLCFDGSVLLCDVIDAEQSGYLAYIDTGNGKLLGKDTSGWDIAHWGDAFLLTKSEEHGAQALYGTWSSDIVTLAPAGEGAQIWPALPLGGAVAVHETAEGLTLDFYVLESGLRTASVTLAEGTDAYGFAADAQNSCVWFLLGNDAGEQTLCRWDYEMSAVADEMVYTIPRYTEDHPDTEGLAQCRTQAQALGGAYGLDIRIWDEAVTAPWEDMTADYRVSSFRETLAAMEKVLSAFPEGMVAKVASLNDSGKIKVSLVRGASEVARGYLKWYNGSASMAVETGNDGADAFCNALYRAMDTYILNSNSMLDEWDSHTPVDDRAMIFEYAMSQDMGAYFDSSSAQSKLQTLCSAIRDAFELKSYEGTLPWEQYLSE